MITPGGLRILYNGLAVGLVAALIVFLAERFGFEHFLRRIAEILALVILLLFLLTMVTGMLPEGVFSGH